MWAALGLAAMTLTMRFDYRHYREPSFIWMALGAVTVALVAVLFGRPINGSSRWFGLGGTGVQPSELAKLSAIFFMAAILERRMDRIDELQYALVPIALTVALLVALILAEPDMGTA
jgi:cell division protein FtsW